MFPTLVAAVCLSALIIVGGGCSKTHESIADDEISKMKDFQNALKDVKDEASAKAAAEKIKAIAADLKKLKEEDDKLPKATDDEKKKIEEKIKKASDENEKEMQAVMAKIGSDPKLAAPIMQAIMEAGATMPTSK
jgi:hypothetical protein